MYKLCKTEQSAMRQRQLEQGLQQAMLAQQYEDISISDLCDRLGIPRKSFYRYFSSKDGALAALLDHTLMEFEQSASHRDKPNAGTAIGDLERYFIFRHERRDFLDALDKGFHRLSCPSKVASSPMVHGGGKENEYRCWMFLVSGSNLLPIFL